MAVSKDWQGALTTDSEEREKEFEWILRPNNTPAKAETRLLFLLHRQAALDGAGRRKP